MQIVSLNESQFDRFASNHQYKNYYQTSNFKKVIKKFGYYTKYLGILNDQNKLIGASLIIYKEVFMGKFFGYAPRGILFDYSIPENVNEMTKELKKVLNKEGFILLRIDPYIPLTIRSSEGDIINVNNQGEKIISTLESAGWTYKGKTMYFETEKPRWESLIILNDHPENLFNKFSKQIRNKIRKASANGIIIEKDTNKDVEKVYDFFKKKSNRPINYYKELIENYSENIDIYIAKVDTEALITNARKTYEKEVEINDEYASNIQDMSLPQAEKDSILNKKMNSDKLLTSYKNNLIQATELLKQNPNGLNIAAAIVIYYDNAAYIFVEGIDEEYTNLNASYLLKWQLINDCYEKKMKYINLDGIVGELNEENKYSGLNEMKLGFNSLITEYIGEFDLIINQFNYNLFKKFKK